MLYVTTRNNRDAYTAHRALCEKSGPDGGAYVPYREPEFTSGQIEGFEKKPFSQCVAEVLNVLFNTRLTGWDIDFAVGRYGVRLSSMSHRIVIAETWHNPAQDFGYMVRGLVDYIRIRGNADACGDWTWIAVRIAILFGIYGELRRSQVIGREDKVDISLVSGDFSAPMAAWYARRWGLPIGNIVCCCNENNGLWELMHQGGLRTGAPVMQTSAPEADVVVPKSLERLIFACAGYSETQRYVDICRRGGVYQPNDQLRSRLRSGLDVSVVGSSRLDSAILNVYRTNSRIFGPYTALAYTGLLDYRARTGESRAALILSERNPLQDLHTTAHAMGISPEALAKIINEL